MYGNQEDRVWGRRKRQLAALAEKVRSGSSAKHEVKVELWRGQARESVWLSVVSLKQQQYGGWQVHGELQEPSVLWPHLTAGTRLEVGQYQVVELTEE
jgi:hypothetical protein